MIHVIGLPTFKLYIYTYYSDNERWANRHLKRRGGGSGKESGGRGVALPCAGCAPSSSQGSIHLIVNCTERGPWYGRPWWCFPHLTELWLVCFFCCTFYPSGYVMHVYICLYQTMTIPLLLMFHQYVFTYWYAHEFVNVGCIDSIPSYYTYIYIYIAIHCN